MLKENDMNWRSLAGIVLTIAVVLGGMLFSPAPARALTPIVVNNHLVDAPDGVPGDGVCETLPGNGICTLRAAVIEANARPGIDGIVVPTGIYNLTRPGDDASALNGDLDITDDY
jgi:CSLREA domain-containing protein